MNIQILSEDWIEIIASKEQLLELATRINQVANDEIPSWTLDGMPPEFLSGSFGLVVVKDTNVVG